MQATFTGFDSAWAANNSGAICDLALQDDGSLELVFDPEGSGWDQALERAEQEKSGDLRVWAIDQPICVRNQSGCRSVERDLARALMADFACGAHSSNLGNPCWARDAKIWSFLHALEENNYVHIPMSIPGAQNGHYYFECYPHPALLGLFDLDRIVKYKVRHRDAGEWRKLIGLLRSLAMGELPIRNICSFVHDGVEQDKENEDRLDAIISAYVAAYWWKFGTDRSTVIGNLDTGYIITPHSKRTYEALVNVFGVQINQRGPACAPPASSTIRSLEPRRIRLLENSETM